MISNLEGSLLLEEIDVTPIGSPRKQEWFKLGMELDEARQSKKRAEKAIEKAREVFEKQARVAIEK